MASAEGVTDLYPSLSDLDVVDDRAGNLLHGDPVREYVFEGAEVDLGKDVDAGFALTFGIRRIGRATPPAIAEISFKYDTRRRQRRARGGAASHDPFSGDAG